MYKLMVRALAGAAMLWAIPALAYPYVYVTQPNASSVTVVDAANNTIVRTIPSLGHAQAVAVNSNGTRAYIGGGSAGTVTVLQTAMIADPNQSPVIGSYTSLGDVTAVAVGPLRTTLYVADAGKGQVYAIDMPSSHLTGTYAAAGAGLTTFALDPAGRRLAVASGTGGTSAVRLYDLANGTHTDVSLSAQPTALEFDNQGNTLWIGTSGGIVTYNLTDGSRSSIAVSGGVGALAYDLRAGTLYAASASSAAVYAYPAAGGTPVTVTLPGVPTGLAVSPDGTRAYATTAGGLTVIDTGTNQVATNVSLAQSPSVAGNFVGPGDIYADNTSFADVVGQQLSGSVTAGDYQSRQLSYDVMVQPPKGQLNFTQATGDFTYTPPSGYSGIQSFVWEATASGGTGSPTQPRSRPVTATLLVKPTLSGPFADQKVDAGASIGPLDFSLQGTTPLDVVVTSSNKQAVDPAAAQLSSGCGTSGNLDCTLSLTAGSTKGASATVSVTATDPSGLAAKQSFKVTINGGGGGGGGSLPWPVLAVLAALLIATRMRRRMHDNGRI